MDVLRQRLATQRLTSGPLPSPGDVVDLLTCVQCQERDHALFSLGLRSRRATLRSTRTALDRGDFVRTHILRPTWHFVRPADLRWILALTSERVERSIAGRHRELGLDDERYVGRALERLADLLRGRRFATRAEIGRATAGRPDFPEAGSRLGHLLMIAELRGLVCSGPSRGPHHAYALVDEVVPAAPELDRDGALARLVHRFFAGHGPASDRDFARWSSLTLAETRRGIELAGDALERVEVDGVPLWFDPSRRARRSPAAAGAWLLPTYDEVVLTYPALGFPVADGHPHAAADDPFWAPVVVGTTNVGMWKRTVTPDAVEVDVRLAASIGEGGRAAVGAAAQRLAEFVQRPLRLTVGGATPPLWGGRPSARGRIRAGERR
jgi:hypothetical protein